MAHKGARWDHLPDKLSSAKPPDPKQRMQALGRLPAGTMNKTELAYARRLEALKFSGDILWYEFEPINIRLAPNTFYKVDFLVMTKSGEIEAHEVKGFWTDDARVKIKVAAAKIPFKFIGARLIKGDWQFEYF